MIKASGSLEWLGKLKRKLGKLARLGNLGREFLFGKTSITKAFTQKKTPMFHTKAGKRTGYAFVSLTLPGQICILCISGDLDELFMRHKTHLLARFSFIMGF